MTTAIAFVGAGPTTIYTLAALLDRLEAPTRITIFESQRRAGLGSPYRPGWNDPAMLSNIASVEIPPLSETLVAWLGRQPRARLVRLGIDPDTIDDHAFYPRLALGEYFLDRFHAMIERAAASGVSIEVATDTRVTDIRADADGFCLVLESGRGATCERSFAQVVLATGHQWPEEPEVQPGYFASPWPATALQRIPAVEVGIRGSSLTAIDAVVAIACAHGSFIETSEETVEYRSNPGAETLKLTMMSRKGLLPEADFHHPVPYEPLSICTPAAMERLIAEDCPTLLTSAYDLFRAELAAADPDYAARIGLADLPLEDFAGRYFAERTGADPFDWAATNLAEARANYATRHTIAWRYAILRMHEVLALIVPHLSGDALERFDCHLKPVFVDDYATVPHLSIERMLALHRAGRLSVLALGEGNRVETRGVDRGAVVVANGERRHFPVFVDATGQRPLAIDDFPFPTLREQGVVCDVGDGARGIAVDDRFHPASSHPAARRLYILSLPFILGRHPFIQGITSSYELGETVGAALAQTEARLRDAA